MTGEEIAEMTIGEERDEIMVIEEMITEEMNLDGTSTGAMIDGMIEGTSLEGTTEEMIIDGMIEGMIGIHGREEETARNEMMLLQIGES